MNLSVNLQVRQSQSLVMTPQLLQSIRLLQFHHVELQAFLEREIEANPLLEIAGPVELPTDGATPAFEIDTLSEPLTPLSGARDDGTAFVDAVADDPTPHADAAETPLAGLRSQDNRGNSHPGGADILDTLSEGAGSIHAHALAEIAEIFPDPAERRIAGHLFGDLDEAGYLAGDLQEAMEALALEPERLEALLSRLQTQAEPAGLFARNLSECLAIQLSRRNRLDPVMQAVLDNLPLLAKRDFAALSRLTGEDEADLLEILSEIRTLDPRPGAVLSSPTAETVLPDVIVRAGAGGSWQVELNPDAFPRVLVHQTYARQVLAGAATAEEKSFLTGCQQSAIWLVRSLDQRARTILKVASEIVRRQDQFLLHGIAGLKPMTLMDVAETIGMHESTVSRVTANKFISTPRGTFEMKFFFTVSIGSSNGGEAHSAESVKLRLQRMIAGERPDAVLSDDDIAAQLKASGIDLARRTVAKYREAMGIASSVQRRREMNARRLAG